ncbi:stress protein [Bacillus tequilensis]|nr:stress protein [Bacillus tequilensis]
MKDVLRKYVTEEPSSYPAFIVFINDGGCKKSIKPIIEASSDKPVFWQFVGIGNGNFDFLNQLDTLEGRVVDNTNSLQIEEIDRI